MDNLNSHVAGDDGGGAAAIDSLDAARYRVLRMFKLNGSWPFDQQGVAAPGGILAWSAMHDEEGYTRETLDRMLDVMLGRIPKKDARPDYQEWMAQSTHERIEAAAKIAGGAA